MQHIALREEAELGTAGKHQDASLCNGCYTLRPNRDNIPGVPPLRARACPHERQRSGNGNRTQSAPRAMNGKG